ncbi:MAG: UMP kinase [Opitutales bacterium]|nr:UMP kinase [Opitutales bacterium]
MTETKTPKYKRIVLKISGEALKNNKTGNPFDPEILNNLAQQMKTLQDLKVQVCLVVGGGNIFRGLAGAKNNGTDRTTGDNMGMLATTINALAIMDCLEKNGIDVRVQTAIPMDKIAEPFILRRALRHLEKGRVVIFAAGTGNPFCTTDYAAALRANEVHADIIFKATKVDGIYTADPMKDSTATRYESLTYEEALMQHLGVMDATAFALCQENKMPILVFSMNEKDSIERAILGDPSVGTIVK